ncbi:unnamed protein product [Closterium sp. NIES-54]
MGDVYPLLPHTSKNAHASRKKKKKKKKKKKTMKKKKKKKKKKKNGSAFVLSTGPLQKGVQRLYASKYMWMKQTSHGVQDRKCKGGGDGDRKAAHEQQQVLHLFSAPHSMNSNTCSCSSSSTQNPVRRTRLL